MNGSSTVNYPTSLLGCKVDTVFFMNDMEVLGSIGLFIITTVILNILLAFIFLLIFIELSAEPFYVTLLFVVMTLNICILI